MITATFRRPEKLLYVGAINPNVSNGSTIHFFNLGQEFTQQGFSVDMVIPKMKAGTTLPFIDFSEIRFVLHQKGSLIKWRLPPSLNLIIQIPWILYYLLKKKIKYVYIRSNITSFTLVTALRWFSKAFIVVEHNGLIADESIALGYPRWIAIIAKLTQTLDAKMAHLVRVVTPGLKECLIDYGVAPNKIFVASNGTNIFKIYPIARDAAILQLKLDPMLLYIGFAGNLVVWQGLEIALKAFALVLQRISNVRFVIAGEGPEKSKLHAIANHLQIAEKVMFLNHIPANKINTVINVFDVCVAPFLQERNSKIGLSPIKIRDYAAAGKPIVAANIAGISDESTIPWLITHEPNNVEDLAEKLIDILLHTEKRKAMSKSAREYAENNYQWKVVVEKILHHIGSGTGSQSIGVSVNSP